MKATIDWQVSPAAWQAFVDACPEATFFHTPAWYAAHADSRGLRVATAKVTFETGETAILPMAVSSRYRGLLKAAEAGIEAGYGGWLSRSPLTAEQRAEADRLVRARYPDLTITGNPHGQAAPGAAEPATDFTQVIPLLPREAQLAHMSNSRAKTVLKSQREGYTLEVYEQLNESHVELFYALYEEHSSSWAYTKHRHDRDYFKALLRHAGAKMVLFLAKHGDELAGYRILCLQGPVVIALFLGRAKAYEKRNVSPYLMGESLAWAYEHGYTAFDVLPSGQLEGVREYKASFGAASLPYAVVRHTGWAGASLEAIWKLTKGKPAEMAPAS